MMIVEKNSQSISDNNIKKGKRKIDWGRQGGVILAYTIVLLGYYGIVANIVMVENWISLAQQTWISFTDMDRTVLFWTFESYLQTYFLPVLLVFFVCFVLTYKEDIPHYGIKASIWIVPSLIIEAFFFYWLMFGFTEEPFIWQFGNWKGYLQILILFAITLSGAICGMELKKYVKKARTKIEKT